MKFASKFYQINYFRKLKLKKNHNGRKGGISPLQDKRVATKIIYNNLLIIDVFKKATTENP